MNLIFLKNAIFKHLECFKVHLKKTINWKHICVQTLHISCFTMSILKENDYIIVSHNTSSIKFFVFFFDISMSYLGALISKRLYSINVKEWVHSLTGSIRPWRFYGRLGNEFWCTEYLEIMIPKKAVFCEISPLSPLRRETSRTRFQA